VQIMAPDRHRWKAVTKVLTHCIVQQLDIQTATGKKRMCGSADAAMGNAVIKL